MAVKTLLIDTPYNLASTADPPRVYLSQAALYLGTALRHAGHNPVIYDPKISCKKTAHAGMYYVGDTFTEIEKRIRREKPDVVGVTNLFSKDANNVIEVCKRAKKVNPKITTAVGGPHATSMPQDFLAEKAIDLVAIGEGEETIVDIMRWREGQIRLADIKGIAYKNRQGTAVFTAPREPVRDLDQLGWPDYSLIDLDQYFAINARGFGPRPLGQGRRLFSLSTSRGCPYLCFFCAARNIAGLRFRPYSVKAVVKHIQQICDRYSVDSLAFEDDNISFDRPRFSDLIDSLLQLKPRLVWGTPNGVRADTLLDKRLLRKIKRSGCQYLTVGVESGNQEVINKIVNKRLDLRVIEKLAKMCAEIDLPLNGFFIIGFPDETLAQIHDTLNFALKLHRDYGFYPFVNFAIPIPGTRMYDICQEKGYLTEKITAKSLVESTSFRGRGKIRTSQFTPELLSKLMREFNGRIFRSSLWRAVKSLRVALRYTNYALRNFSHFKRYVIG